MKIMPEKPGILWEWAYQKHYFTSEVFDYSTPG